MGRITLKNKINETAIASILTSTTQQMNVSLLSFFFNLGILGVLDFG